MLHEQRKIVFMWSNVLKWSCSAREYIMFASARLIPKWHEQRPSNKGDLDVIVTGEDGAVCYMRWTWVWLVSVTMYVIVIGLVVYLVVAFLAAETCSVYLYRVIQKSRNPWGKRTISRPSITKVPVCWESFLNDFQGDWSKRALMSCKLSLLRTEGRPERRFSPILPVSRKRSTRRW
jgi:hypothetical protein